jgi:hypothetical protein
MPQLLDLVALTTETTDARPSLVLLSLRYYNDTVHVYTRFIENILVVTGKDMKRTFKRKPQIPLEKPKSTKFWRSSV